MGHAVWVGLVVGFAGFLVAGWEEVGVDVDFGRHGSGLLLSFFWFSECLIVVVKGVPYDMVLISFQLCSLLVGIGRKGLLVSC